MNQSLMKPPEGQSGTSLTKRELDVLELIALGLTNAEIARQLSLSRRTVDTHVERILGKLGAPTRTRAVLEASRARLLPTAPDAGLRSHNLPVQLTNFIGRDIELSEVKALLGTSRLVTIVGAGGVGKTRLAVQVGAESLDTYPDGVWVADLAKISGADAVVPAIASALAVKARGFRTLEEHLLAFLRQKCLLLVLDNCEHVVAEAARVVEVILITCPEVSLLTTSRERLGGSGERVYRLPSLDVPPPDSEPCCETMLEFSAVALFVDRARAADSHFQFSKSAATAISDICRRLDGIALAIELAAARVTTLSPQQLLERLTEQFRILSGSVRGAHPRHRTMRATLDWSYEWLSETEQMLFRRLAIFHGGWTIDALHAVGMSAALDELALLDELTSLVDKSIVVAELRGDAQRYRLMEPLRQYALEMLGELGEFETTARSHARYFGEWSRREGGKYQQISEVLFVATIEEEIDNIRAALEWTLVQGNDPVLGAEIASNLGGFWFTHHYHEGLRWLDRAQAAVTYEEHPALSAGIAVHRIRVYAQTNLNEALRIGEETEPAVRASGQGVPLARFAIFYGLGLMAANRFDKAEAIFLEALEVAERSDDRYRIQFYLWGLARLNRKRGNVDAARAFSMRMAEAHERYQLPEDRNRWVILSERACSEEVDGRLDHAIELCREAYGGTQATRDVTSGVQAEYYLGVLLLRSGAADEARMHGRSVLTVGREELLPLGVYSALRLLAGVATQCKRYDLAARLLGFAEPRLPANALHVDVDPEWFLQPLREHFGMSTLAELMADGATWSEDRAIQEALSV